MGTAYAVKFVSDATLRAVNYEPAIDRMRLAPKKVRARGWTQRPLGELVCELGRAYAKVLKRVDCDPSVGDELLSQVDIFAAEPAGRRIRGDLMPFVEDLRIRKGDTLIAGAGQIGESTLFGRAMIADDRLAGKLAAADVMMLRFENPDADASLYTYAFLASWAGLRGVRTAAYGTSIPRMRPDLLAAMPVPLPDEGTQSRVAKGIRRCMIKRELYLRELRAARQVIERLPEVQRASVMCAERKARVVVWKESLPTLRAWNYASTGDALAYLRREWPGRLSDSLEPAGIFKGDRLTRVPCERPYGVDLLSQRDVFGIRPLPRRIQRPSGALLEVEEAMLLLASRGQMNEGALFGSVERGAHMPAGAIVTEDITRLRPRPGLGEGLYALLSTAVGLCLLRSTAYGTSIPGMRIDLLGDLPIPGEASLKATRPHIEAATSARREAARAESDAIRIVEQEVLSVWLG